MENPYWHPEEKSHVINTDDIRSVAFDVFTIVRSSLSMVGLSGVDEEDREEKTPSPIEHLHYELAEIKLSKALLQIAVMVRTVDDFWTDYGHEDYVAKVETLNKDNSFGTQTIGDKTSDLSLREALNKIIHARDVRPVYDSEDIRDDPEARWGMDGQLELKGAMRKIEWQATVNIFELLDGVVELIDQIDELYS